MEALLRPQDRRLLALARILSPKTQAGIPLTKLAQELACSLRQVRYDLQVFTRLFTEVELRLSPSRVQLLLPPYIKDDYFTSILYRQTPSLRIIDALLADESLTRADLVQQCQMSLPTLYHWVQKLNCYLLPTYRIHIQLAPLGWVGHREDIDYFRHDYYLRTYPFCQQPLVHNLPAIHAHAGYSPLPSLRPPLPLSLLYLSQASQNICHFALSLLQVHTSPGVSWHLLPPTNQGNINSAILPVHGVITDCPQPLTLELPTLVLEHAIPNHKEIQEINQVFIRNLLASDQAYEHFFFES